MTEGRPSFSNLKRSNDVPLYATDGPKAVEALKKKKAYFASEEGKKAWKEAKKKRRRERTEWLRDAKGKGGKTMWEQTEEEGEGGKEGTERREEERRRK